MKRTGKKVDKWIEETISGTVKPENRDLGKLLKNAKKDDVIICSELSRLGRSMFMIMSILNILMDHGIKVYTVKENYRLGDDLPSKVLAFAFSISAEIERALISQRTTEALKRKKSEGVVLGHPKGKKNSHHKLDGKEAAVRKMIAEGYTKVLISQQLGVSVSTLYLFLKEKGIKTL